MKQGSISVLFGCHSPIHSLVVLIAWCKLYNKFPNYWQFICIFLHDIGHWGVNYLDDYEAKKRHAILGAKVARFLFGIKGYDFVIGHNEYDNALKSKLYEPDKYSWVIAPLWWMTSNTYFEPKLIRKGNTRKQSAIMFKNAMIENMKNGWKERGHDIYLKQWNTSNTITPATDARKLIR
jgi:hypothetical protein